MGTHLRVLSESCPMNTNMTGFKCFSVFSLHSCALDESRVSIGRVNGLSALFNRCKSRSGPADLSDLDGREVLMISSRWNCQRNIHAGYIPDRSLAACQIREKTHGHCHVKDTMGQTHRANFIKPLDTWFKVKPGHNLKIDQVSKLGQFH